MDVRSHRPMLFPYSPSVEEWDRLSSDERRRYYESIPQKPAPIDELFDLDPGLVAGRLRVFQGTAGLPFATELIVRLEGLVKELEQRCVQADQARLEAKQAKDEETKATLEAERRLAELEAELARLRVGKSS